MSDILLRLSAAEHARVRELARAHGMPVSRWIRFRMLSEDPATATTDGLIDDITHRLDVLRQRTRTP